MSPDAHLSLPAAAKLLVRLLAILKPPSAVMPCLPGPPRGPLTNAEAVRLAQGCGLISEGAGANVVGRQLAGLGLIRVDIVGVVLPQHGESTRDDPILLLGQQLGEGVEEANLGLVCAHRFDSSAKEVPTSILKVRPVILFKQSAMSSGTRNAAGLARRHKTDDDGFIRVSQVASLHGDLIGQRLALRRDRCVGRRRGLGRLARLRRLGCFGRFRSLRRSRRCSRGRSLRRLRRLGRFRAPSSAQQP